MSDGISAVFKDAKIVELVKDVRGLQKEYYEKPSNELAENIVSKLEDLLKYNGKGYWKGVNAYEVQKDIEKYKKYLNKKG